MRLTLRLRRGLPDLDTDRYPPLVRTDGHVPGTVLAVYAHPDDPEVSCGGSLARWVDACLAIFPKAEFEALAGKVGGLGIADASARTFSRALFASAYEVELDRQGRIVVPASLRDLLGLANDAVIVGARDHAEIWEPAAWDDYRKAMEAPDALAAHLTGLGI